MTPNTETANARLLFNLTMEKPGPSQGDAFEHVETLGINPWAFEGIKPVAEVVNGGMVTGTFEAIGHFNQILDLVTAIMKSEISAHTHTAR